MATPNRKRPHSDDDSENEDMLYADEGGTMIEGIYIPPPIEPITRFQSENRLIITKITNTFFKSYANEQILGPFTKCFNAIVGPNGSGKSNVIDAMLFVFGYRAAKIRSKKVSALIHNSERYSKVQSATVAVHFCQIIDKPGKNYEIIPGSEFVVSRTAHKDNSSFYQLDGRKVQFREVAILLKKHGIDLDHNRFLILQGEVEEIAMMKPKGTTENETGLLEYLEDIIGTTRYKQPLLELSNRIELLTMQRSEKLNRVKLIENELEKLKEPMQEAVVFLNMENKAMMHKNFLYQKNTFDLQEDLKEYEKEKSAIAEVHTEISQKLETLAQEKAEKEAFLKQEATKYESLQKRVETLKEAFGKADKKDVQLQAEMTQLNNNRKKFKEQLAEQRKKLQQLERIPEENDKLIAECKTKEAELLQQKEKLEEEKTHLLTKLRDETKDLQLEKEQLEIKLDKLNKSVSETKSAYDLAESELKICLSSEENELNKLTEIQQKLQDTNDTVKQLTNDISALKTKIPPTEKSLREAAGELQTVKNEEAQIINKIRQKRLALEEKRSSMQMSRSRGRVLDSLMQQKREGNREGIYGRLGDLGAIDKKYDVAISTACGPLDNIVVDTAETAQWCIEFLKTHGIGRAMFIALDKQEHLREVANSKIRTPENAHRLYDLIQMQDETLKTAFYFALRDTLVADNLDQATRIAYGAKRYRVVTLNGELIEISGTMSGGGKTVARGRMGQSVVAEANPKDLEMMEVDLKNLEDRARDLRQSQTSLEGQVRILETELPQMKSKLNKFSTELQSLKQGQPVLVEQLKRQEKISKSTKADPKQVEKLQNFVQEKKVNFDKASATAEELQVKVNELTKEIKEKTSGKMKAIDKDLNDVVKIIDKCKSEITRLSVAIKTSGRNIKKATQQIATLEQDIEDAENRLRAMKSERETIECDGKKLLQCIAEITEQLSNGEDEYEDLKAKVSKIRKAENKLKLEEVDVNQKMKTIQSKVDECNNFIQQWKKKLSELKLHEIPNETTEELKQYTQEEISEVNLKEIELDLHTIEKNLKSAKPNLNVIQEYRNGQDIYMERSKDLEVVTGKRNQMRDVLERVKNQRKVEFMTGYNVIKLKLKEMYQMITLGGDADFEIVDSFDPFSEGIQFSVRPPKKSWKHICNLSGGEKTLSSLALVFALHYYKPSPLYVMDEIDAALDFKNVSIVGHYIKERTKDAQFIIISLRSNMFELCDNLVGIYKVSNCTRTLAIDPTFYDRVLNDHAAPQISEENTENVDTNNRSLNGEVVEQNNSDNSEDMFS